MSNLNLTNLKINKNEILKAEIGTLLFNLGKTHAGFNHWKDYFQIENNNFKRIFGYTPFSSYKDYYKNNN